MSAALKVSCVSTSRVPSAAANSIQVMKTCQALARGGHSVHLLVPGTESVPWEVLSEHYGLADRFDVSWLPAHPRLRRNDFAWGAVTRARRMSADLLYTWTGQSAVFGLLHQIPVAYELHDLPSGRLGPLWFRLFLRLPGRKRLLPITRALRQKLEQNYGAIPDEQWVIAPNGVDLEQYDNLPLAPAARAELDLPDSVTVLCAGHLYAGRGAELFVNLARRFPAGQLCLGGRAARPGRRAA
jgi:glycosyltransferase involved in cell wall biosynthesis